MWSGQVHRDPRFRSHFRELVAAESLGKQAGDGPASASADGRPRVDRAVGICEPASAKASFGGGRRESLARRVRKPRWSCGLRRERTPWPRRPSPGTREWALPQQSGFGYKNTPAIRIAAPPAAAVAPAVWPVMRVDSRNLAPYDNYQVQFKPELGGTWGNWDGGLFTSAGGTNSQYLFITNGPGLFRLQYVP